jgi:hypothetical protein
MIENRISILNELSAVGSSRINAKHGAAFVGRPSSLKSLFRDLEEIRGETALSDNGISDSEKFAWIVAKEPKYRAV